jgi:hypothetical protein
MGELAIRDLDFEAATRLEGNPELKLIGSADTAIVGQLAALIEELHGQLVTSGAREIVVDIRGLEFMNASCFNVLVNWLSLIHDLEPEQRYHLHFSTNLSMPWQKRSLNTLSCFATDLVVLEGGHGDS